MTKVFRLVAIASLAASEVLAQSGEAPTAPEGFTVQIFAENLGTPRGMAFGPDGHLYVTDSRGGRVLVLVDRDGDEQADSVATLLEGLDRPSGIAWHDGELWVAEVTRVVRIGRPPAVGTAPELHVVVDGLPAGGFTTRSVVFEPSGRGFFISVGSSCNTCREEDSRRAAILLYSLDGRGPQIWARGLRNAVGLAVHPETWELWALDAGRDWLGDDLPPDELNIVRRGGHYGWPYCYGARIPDPEYDDPARCDVTEVPVMNLPAHSTPLGIAFYDGELFPSEYRGDAFVTLHGSWNRSAPAGYKVLRVSVEAGRPVAVEDFLDGWLGAAGGILGRPVQPLIGPDGALYVSDDHAGRVWRVAYARSD
jgi:glucose/arabinose dehydrogenase